MADRPILFSAPMVLAILASLKTQTRRVLRDQPGDLDKPFMMEDGTWHVTDSQGGHMSSLAIRIRRGDRLWVRETVQAHEREDGTDGVLYLADRAFIPIENTPEAGGRWVDLNHYGKRRGAKVPAIHMPKWASRISLKVTDVRVQRLQDISEADAIAEGIHQQPTTGWYSVPGVNGAGTTSKAAYATLWNHINGAGAWQTNPWIIAYTFERTKP